MPEVRLITPITKQSTKKMQVAAYCRVSSNSADQLNSYAAQIRAYKKCIGARDDWELVDIFADEGLTGMKSETRDEFQRMIRMCELKQIDHYEIHLSLRTEHKRRSGLCKKAQVAGCGRTV